MEVAGIASALFYMGVLHLPIYAFIGVSAASLVMVNLIVVLPAAIIMRVLQSYCEDQSRVTFLYTFIGLWYGENDWSYDFFCNEQKSGDAYVRFFLYDALTTVFLYSALIAIVMLAGGVGVPWLLPCVHPVVQVIRSLCIHTDWMTMCSKIFSEDNRCLDVVREYADSESVPGPGSDQSIIRALAYAFAIIVVVLFFELICSPVVFSIALEIIQGNLTGEGGYAALCCIGLLVVPPAIALVRNVVRVGELTTTWLLHRALKPLHHGYRVERFNSAYTKSSDSCPNVVQNSHGSQGGLGRCAAKSFYVGSGGISG